MVLRIALSRRALTAVSITHPLLRARPTVSPTRALCLFARSTPRPLTAPIPIQSGITTQHRHYAAKKKGKGKEAKGGKNKQVKEDDIEGDENEAGEVEEFQFDVKEYSDHMLRGVERFKTELGDLRLGRANPALLESVIVAHKGSRVPLSQIAQVNVKDAQTLMVILNEEELLSVVDKAIRSADLNLNPQKQESNVLRVPIPKITKEYKDSLVKKAAQLAEKTRNHIRTTRSDARNDLKKAAKKTVASDVVRGIEKEIQTATDKYIGQIDTLLATKQKEIERA